MKLVIKKADADGRLAMVPQLLDRSWEISVVDGKDAIAYGAALADADAAISMNWDASMPAAPRLRIMQLPGAGTDIVDMATVPPTAFVCNAFEHEIGIAEYVVGTMLQWVIGTPRMDREFRAGRWYGSFLCGPRHTELFGKTLGIIGYGRIGRETARRVRGFGMRVLACTRTPGPADGLADEMHGLAAMPAVLERSDFILLGLPLTAETRNLIDAAALKRMKSDAVIINVARGSLIDESALFEALRSRRIGGAILDTWWQYPEQGQESGASSNLPFHELDNTILTPHASAWTDGLLPRRCGAIADNINRIGRGETPVSIVRQPLAALTVN